MKRFAVLLSCCWAASCATTTPLPPGQPAAHLQLEGSISLSDGSPLGGLQVSLRCRAGEHLAITDEGGRFQIQKVPEGTCWLSAPKARLQQQVRVSSGLMRGRARLDLRLPPMHRLSLSWAEANRHGSLFLDETVPHGLAAGRHQLALGSGQLFVDGRPLAPLVGLRQGQRLSKGQLQLTVSSLERRAFLPLGLRRWSASARAIDAVPLLTDDGQLVRPARGTRTLVVAGGCDQLRAELLDDLEALAVAHESTGVKVLAILTAACPGRQPAGRPLLGGPEALWVLGARPGELVILDVTGRPDRRVASVEEARAYLERSFPLFAATSKVSVAPSVSVVEAEADRLLGQARAKVRAGQHGEAHQLLDAVLRLAPDLAEARKQRALTKARLGDLSGALSEVTWWRSSFGADSADELLEEVERTAKVSALR